MYATFCLQIAITLKNKNGCEILDYAIKRKLSLFFL